MNSMPYRFAMISLRLMLRVGILCALLPAFLETGREDGLFAAEPAGYQIRLQVQWTASQNSRRTLILLPGENVSLEQGTVLRDAPLHREELIAHLKRAPSQEWRVSFDDPTTQGSVAFLLQGHQQGTLHVVLRDELKLLGEITLTLAELSQASREIAITKGEGTLRIHRENVGPIQILPRKSHVLHEPGEQFQAQVVGQFTGPIDRRHHPVLRWEILSSRTAKILSEGKLNFQIPKRTSSSALAMDVQIPLPASEGVYDLRVQLETREGVQPGSNTIQLVVHGSAPVSLGSRSPLKEDRSISRVSAEGKAADVVSAIPTVEEIRTPIQRKLGLVLHAPWEIAQFRDDRWTDPETGRRITDWTTILTAGKKLVTELRARKGDVLILGVSADGVTLTPYSGEAYRSTLIDNGRLRFAAVDPFPKDILELLFRECDQQGCTLIPELNLNGVDEQLEQKRFRDPSSRNRIDLRNQAGNTWTETHPGSALGAHYDPLAPEVQQRIEELAAEIIVRYQHHRSFGGIALALHGETWACLPGVNWGLSQKASSVPSSAVTKGLPVTGSEDSPGIAPARIALRCRSIAELYSRISRRLDQSRQDQKLYLTLDKLLSTASSREDAVHLLRAGQSLENLFPFSGIEPKLLAKESSIHLLRPYLFDPRENVSPEEAILLASFNGSPAITQSFQGSHAILLASAALTAQPTATGNGRPQADPSRFWAQVLGHGDVHELFATWSVCQDLGMKQERSPSRTLHQLPGRRSQILNGVSQPLSVQKIIATDETWLLVINESPLPVTWEFQTVGTLKAPLVKVPGQGTGLQKRDKEEGWTWTLNPYDIQVCRVPTSSFELSSTRVVIPAEQLSRISQRIDQLEKSFVAIRERTPAEKYLLPNADFEQETEQPAQPPGWNYDFQTNPVPRLDPLNPRSGKHSLKLHCENAAVVTKVTTFPLSLNGEKHLAVSLWMRAAQPDSQVRLVFSGPQFHDWSRSTEITCGADWQHYVFRITDVPGELKQATLGIQLSSVGSIWIDDVEMFPQRITPNDERQLTRNLSAIRLAWQEQRYTDCLRLLEGYWARFLTDAPRTSTSGEPRLPQLGTRYRELIIR